MKRLKKTADMHSNVLGDILNKIEEQFKDLYTLLYEEEGSDAYIDELTGKVTIKCKQQYGTFDLYMTFDGQNVTITNDRGDNLKEMKETYESTLD